MKSTRTQKFIGLAILIAACAALLLSSVFPATVCGWGEKKLTVVSTPDSGGTITIESDKPCVANSYPAGTIVTLTAVPTEGCEFEQWSGDIGDNEAGNITISITMDMNRTIAAGFKGCAGPLEITIDYSTYSSGTKTINASFGSVITSAIRTSSGTTVNATATAAEGYSFDGWSGAINGSESTMSFVASASESITASFSKASSSIWTWGMIGVILVLLAGALYYMIKSGKKKRPEEAQTDAAVPPQQPPTPPQGM